jgi:ELWxxDGT repeat protein
LHRSNGQVAGTVRVQDINPGAGSSNPTNFQNLNSTLFFSANNGTNGVELWQSTAFGPGTVLTADINPGAGSSNPAFLACGVATLYFSANNGTNGMELFTLSNPVDSLTGMAQNLGTNTSSIAPMSHGDPNRSHFATVNLALITGSSAKSLQKWEPISVLPAFSWVEKSATAIKSTIPPKSQKIRPSVNPIGYEEQSQAGISGLVTENLNGWNVWSLAPSQPEVVSRTNSEI